MCHRLFILRGQIYFERLRPDGGATSSPTFQRDSAAIRLGVSIKPTEINKTMDQSLKNKRALVTGGSRGIGAAIVKRLASEGADVALTYSSSPDPAMEVVKAAEALGAKALSIQADSADPGAVVAAVERTVAELGGIDVLINNAGVAVIAPLEDFKLEEFDRTFAINVRAVFVATQAAAKHMKEGGRIINIGSTNAERMPFATGGVYAMSKSALQGLVQGLSRDLAGHHDQQRATGAGRYRDEPRKRRICRDTEGLDGAAALRHRGRNRRIRGLSCKPRGRLHHRRKPEQQIASLRIAKVSPRG